MNNTGETCQMKSCCKKIVIPTIAVAVALFAMEWLIHGIWLMPIYKETAALWRPMEEMGMFPLCIVRLLTLSLLFTVMYCKCKKSSAESCGTDGKKPCKVKKSLCFGIMLGLLLGTMMGSSYLWMPIPAELGIKWFIAGLAEGIVVSFVLSLVCCDKKGECNA